jgi:sigma 54 modulation protein/ribosomal protein S30EA
MLEEILSLKKSGADVIVVGPTVSMSPKALFDIDASHAGVYAMHADELLDVIAQAGSGYHFRQICGEIRDKPREPAL